MKLRLTGCVVMSLCLWIVPARAAEPQLTIYNQNFAVVRVLIPLDLKTGENRIQFTDTTAYLEPSSVILRDPTGARSLQILEQNYRADPISQQLLLSLYEGKTLDFLVQRSDHAEIVQGKIIRSGYAPAAAITLPTGILIPATKYWRSSPSSKSMASYALRFPEPRCSRRLPTTRF